MANCTLRIFFQKRLIPISALTCLTFWKRFRAASFCRSQGMTQGMAGSMGMIGLALKKTCWLLPPLQRRCYLLGAAPVQSHRLDNARPPQALPAALPSAARRRLREEVAGRGTHRHPLGGRDQQSYRGLVDRQLLRPLVSPPCSTHTVALATNSP